MLFLGDGRLVFLNIHTSLSCSQFGQDSSTRRARDMESSFDREIRRELSLCLVQRFFIVVEILSRRLDGFVTH